MNRRSILALGLIAVMLFATPGARAQAPAPGPAPANQDYVPDQILVRFQPWVTHEAANQLMAHRGLTRIRQVHPLKTHVLQLPPGLTVEKAIEVLSRRPEVAVVEPNYILRTYGEIVDQWGLAKIHAPEAWAQLGGNPNRVLLATVDTGIDRGHPDLGANIWSNPDEQAGNGIDDDGNGYVDDTWGWDFVNNDNDPIDDNMHGTAVSSVEAAVQDGSGVAGVCPWCQLMAVKVMGANGSGTMDVVARGIIYAADNGARVINLSLGASAGAQVLEDAVNYAWGKGVLVVAAAGNGGNGTPGYPAAYANAMAIASTNDQDYRSCFSQYGTNYISVAAPGEAILSAIPNGGYGSYSGTSLATPHVTALGGLLFSQNPGRTNADVRNLIETTAVDLGPVGKDAYFGTGRIDALRAVMGDNSPTAPPQGMFSTSDTSTGYANSRKLVRDGSGNLHMIWHGQEGNLYRVMYAVSADGGASWSSPQVIFSSTAETYHPALTIDPNYLYVVFPSKHNASYYQIFFTRKPLAGDAWSNPTTLMGGTFDAVRPDIYLDPSNGRLHVVAASLDNATNVYYTASGDGGAIWSATKTVSVTAGGAQNSRYATVHANGSNITIAGRTVELTFFGLLPYFRAFSVRSADHGNTWSAPLVHAEHMAILASEYGLSLAGQSSRLYLVYENNGSIFFMMSTDGVAWSVAENLGAGAWPSLTQAGDGQAWVMWVSDGNLTMRHYTGTIWEPVESLGNGTYPSLKLGTSGGQVEWATTYCSGAPFRIGAGSRSFGANNLPVAEAGEGYSENEDIELTFVGSASFDPDGDALTYTWDFGDGSSGTGVAPSHAYAYGGTFVVMLTVSDGRGGTSTDTATATIAEVNDRPVADAGGPYTGSKGITINLDGSGSYDLDNLDGSTTNNQELTYHWDFGDGSTGTGDRPSHTYSQAGDYTVKLVVNDGIADSDVGTAGVTVAAVNQPPAAVDDSYTTNEDTALDSSAPGVLRNDTDPDGDSLTASLVSGPEHGVLVLGEDGSFKYTSADNYYGPDSFSYRANDGTVDSTPATVTLNITPVNDAPLAADENYTMIEDQLLTIAAPGVLANDTDIEGDHLIAVLVAGPANGTLDLIADGSFSYTPRADFTGTDSFTYRANDGQDGSNIATVRISVQVDILFADGFESGNFAAWSSSVTDGGDLSVNAAATLVGSQGMRVLLDDNVAIYVTDDTPNAESRYRGSFYFDPNSIAMQSGNSHYIFYGYSGASTVVMRVEFRYYKGSYQLRAGLVNDSTNWRTSNWFTIGDGPHYIALDWWAATASGARNGGLTFWIDGAIKANLTGVDNDTRRIDRIRLGAISGIDNGTRGTYYFDAFESRR